MGYKPLEIGMLLLPWLLASAAVAPFSGRLADRYNSSRLAVIGLGTFSVGLLCTALMGPSPSPFDIAWRMAVCGIGYGLFQSPNNRSMQGCAPRERSGAPQAVQGVARVFGQTTGAVIVATVFALEGHPTANGSGITDSALVVTMAAATACAVVATLASLWRGVIAGSIVLARAS
jgi:DHA2 family multidrug resistance protein-like MFS transporter